ncbi:MAG: GNAT family N-acetyltransferase [Phycisphaeraceae bacterium]|nr:GNAT family N-acetyltransferase [Phycisphaeraceae bacterium]
MLRDLGDGLVLRCAKPQDTEALAEFQRVRQFGEDEPVESNADSTRDLMRGDLPGFAPEDWTVVEDEQRGAIVSAQCLISQTWSYGGVHFPVGRVEFVATHPDYRRRGLVRAQMRIAHQWSRQRGELALAISGIPWYYRQFGYEMAVEYWGGRRGHPDAVPRLLDGRSEPCLLRPARPDDVPLLTRLYEQGMRRYLVSCVRDDELWRFDLVLRSRGASRYQEIRVIESTPGVAVGILVHRVAPDARTIVYELEDGVRFENVTPSVLRYLRAFGRQQAGAPKDEQSSRLVLELGSTHPAYEAVCDALPVTIPCYACYIRVPDVPQFMRHIASAMAQRLASSTWAGHTGVCHINFVSEGVRLTFVEGRIKVDAWMPPQLDNRYRPRIRDALFPGLTFLQLLFGYRSVEDLEHAYADCLVASDPAREMLNVLFPPRPSFLWAVE